MKAPKRIATSAAAAPSAFARSSRTSALPRCRTEMRETHNAAGLRTTSTSTSHAATTPHHVGPPTSPPAGADARRDEQPTATGRSPPAEEI
jgi:hypothetical protein